MLEAINKLDGAFSEQDSLILEKLAMLAGIALHNARLIEDSKAASGVDAPPSDAAHRADPTPAPAGGDAAQAGVIQRSRAWQLRGRGKRRPRPAL